MGAVPVPGALMNPQVTLLPANPGTERHQCPLCGYTFSLEEIPERGCRLCPLRHGCEASVCPNCGYCLPQSSRSMEWLRRAFGWLGRKIRPPQALPEDPKAVRLAELSPGMWGRVVALQGVSTNSEARLHGFCILPGVDLHVSQRRPAFVIRIEETSVALDTCLAEAIWVRPLPLPGREVKMVDYSTGTSSHNHRIG